jgi:hypothetical protein
VTGEAEQIQENVKDWEVAFAGGRLGWFAYVLILEEAAEKARKLGNALLSGLITQRRNEVHSANSRTAKGWDESGGPWNNPKFNGKPKKEATV